MLIELDASVEQEIEALTAVEWDALNNLAVAAREGSHILLASRQFADRLSREERIGDRERSLYRTVSERYATFASALGLFRTSVRVTRALVPQRIDSTEKQIIEVPLNFFATSATTQPVILLGENLSDCEFIYEITRAFARFKNMHSISTEFDSRGGGGSTTHDVADAILAQGRRFLLSIVDSDRITPNAALGDTAKAVKRIFDTRGDPVSELIILHGRELENFLPDEFYQNEFGEHVDHALSAAVIIGLAGAGCEIARLYIDVKKGLKLGELLLPPHRPADFDAVWMSVIDAIRNSAFGVDPSHKTCAAVGVCANHPACTCILTRANHTDLLAAGSTSFRRHGKDFWRNMPSYLRTVVEEVARTAFDWGCAMPLQSS